MNKFKKLSSGFVMALAVMLFAACPLLFSACSSDRDKDSSNNQSVGEYIWAVDGFAIDENETDYTPAVGDTYEMVAIKINNGTMQDRVNFSLFWQLYQGSTLVFETETRAVFIDSPNVGSGEDYGTYIMEDNKVFFEGFGFHDQISNEFIIKGKNLIAERTRDADGMTLTSIWRLREKEVAESPAP